MKRYILIIVLFLLPAFMSFGQTSSYNPNFISTQVYDWGGVDFLYGMYCDNPNTVISGRTKDTNNMYNAVIMKTNTEGQRLWTWTGSDNSKIGEISSLPNSTYVFVYTDNLTSKPQGKVASISQEGLLLWEKNISAENPYLMSVDIENQQIAIFGTSYNYVLICDQNGNQTDSIPLNINYAVNKRLRLLNNTLLISGSSSEGIHWNTGGYIAKFEKTDSVWNKTWQYNVPDGLQATFTEDALGNIYVGMGYYYQTYSTYLLKKLDPNGNIIWEKEWVPTNQCLSNAIQNVILLPDNKGVLFVGRLFSTSNDYNGIMLAYDLDGNFLFDKQNSDGAMMEYIRGKFDQQKRLILVGEIYYSQTNSKDIFFQTWSIDGITAVEPLPVPLPTDFSLSQNYPNPFNPTTTIQFSVPEGTNVQLKVFDLLGQEVETLVDEYVPSGTFTAQFTAKGLPSGIYIYQLQAGKFIEKKKMVLLK